LNKNSTPIIRIENISKEFRIGFFRKRVKAVQNLTLEVQSGEIFGFLGPNGAGKTTTIKMLMGLIFPTSGSSHLFGLSARDLRAKARVGFLPENPYFYEYLTGFEFLDFYSRLFGLSRSIRPTRVERLLEQVGLLHSRDIPLRKYSKGMMQRIGIAQALINDPDLVILDEPMSGLDPIGRKEVRDLIFNLREQGKTVFFSSHILQDVEMICDRVAILIRGQLRKVGTLYELLSQQKGRELELTVSGLPPLAAEQIKSMAVRLIVPGERLTIVLPESQLDEALHVVIREQGRIEALVPLKGSLEDLFVQQVQNPDGLDFEGDEQDDENVMLSPDMNNNTESKP
jgi:ABC-2 type transport system ATP-binding protein